MKINALIFFVTLSVSDGVIYLKRTVTRCVILKNVTKAVIACYDNHQELFIIRDNMSTGGTLMKVDQRRLDILNYLFDYRGLNAKQMTAFIYMTPYFSVPNVKQVQRDLKNLVDCDYVTKFLYNEPIIDDEGVIKTQKVSMYYLTQLGYTYMLEYYNVLQGQKGSGFLIDDDFIYGDIPYTTHTPPQKLVDHHLMAINCFIQMGVGGKPIPHRNNLYAAKRFNDKRLRPDAEALINGEIYFLEFDRYTENHEKLVEKFETYAAYFNTLEEKELKRMGKIVFVVDGDGKDRRWNNVLSAYLKGIGKYLESIPLIMCESNELNTLLKYEIDQKSINNELLMEFKQDKNSKFFTLNELIVFRIVNDTNIELVTFQHQYDSTLFTRIKLLFQEAKKRNLVVSNTITFLTVSKPKELNLNLPHYAVTPLSVALYDFYKKAHKQYVRFPEIVVYSFDNDEDEYFY